MKKLKTYFLTLTALASTTTLSAQSQKQLFDFGWKFTHNGTTQLVDLPHDWDILEGPHSGKGATGTGGGWFGYLSPCLVRKHACPAYR
ncbi:hypothetical protein [Segatella bryantii]|uniref:hypothetical protein n=1 Tax=Segatella bryantii TaxID=77095 RepID=UPI00242FE88B|nr:hypothetical protein [Segatella bryantii]